MLGQFGQQQQSNELDLIMQDLLADMGTAFNTEQGTIVWAESYCMARAIYAALHYQRLMSNQLSPADMSVLADRYASMYGLGGLPLEQVQSTIQLLQSQFGTFPTLNNVKTVIQDLLGDIFIDLEWAPELQTYATKAAPTGTENYYSPLSTLYVRVWQPRDNQDNLLMPTPVFLSTVTSFLQIVERWLPAVTPIQVMQLVNSGNSMQPNTITVAAGSTAVVGTSTTFTTDFQAVNSDGFQQPIEVVDDAGTLQTYYVHSVTDNTHMTLTAAVSNSITNRTYRTLGIVMDVPYACDAMQFNI